jgi:amino acid permease
MCKKINIDIKKDPVSKDEIYEIKKSLIKERLVILIGMPLTFIVMTYHYFFINKQEHDNFTYLISCIIFAVVFSILMKPIKKQLKRIAHISNDDLKIINHLSNKNQDVNIYCSKVKQLGRTFIKAEIYEMNKY